MGDSHGHSPHIHRCTLPGRLRVPVVQRARNEADQEEADEADFFIFLQEEANSEVANSEEEDFFSFLQEEADSEEADSEEEDFFFFSTEEADLLFWFQRWLLARANRRMASLDHTRSTVVNMLIND
jgi:hypothetical protein